MSQYNIVEGSFIKLAEVFLERVFQKWDKIGCKFMGFAKFSRENFCIWGRRVVYMLCVKGRL